MNFQMHRPIAPVASIRSTIPKPPIVMYRAIILRIGLDKVFITYAYSMRR